MTGKLAAQSEAQVPVPAPGQGGDAFRTQREVSTLTLTQPAGRSVQERAVRCEEPPGEAEMALPERGRNPGTLTWEAQAVSMRCRPA